MLVENALLASLNPPHPSRISELDTELSAYASGLGDLESINVFAEDSSRETGAKGGSILPFSRLDSAASVALPSNLQRCSDPGCSTTSGTEPRHNTLVDEQNDNYSTTLLTGGVENKNDAASIEPWGDKYTEGDWRITNDGKIDSIITTESTLSLASLTTTSSGDSSNILSSIDIMQVDVKRRLSGDNDDRDRPLRKRRKGSPITSTDREQYKFACPFRKYNPAKYGIQHRSGICALSQWDCISRLKEHLYRCHMAPQQCLRCGDTFKTAGDLESHSKRPVACDPKSAVFPEGITPAIYQILKSRKKLTRGQSEEERWKDIYKVLFPMANDIPKPYFEPIQEEPAQALLENYENFSSRQLPRLLRYYLEKDLSSLLSGSRNLTEELVSLMEHCHAKILESYRSQYWNDSMTSTSFYKAPTALTPVTVPASRTTTPMSTLAHNELCSPTSLETGFKGSLNSNFEPFELLEKLSEDELY